MATVTTGVAPAFVLVGGVPGAGKTTALAVLAQRLPDVVVVDPERYRTAFASTLPGLPYRAYRPLVHVLHATAVLRLLLAGPGRLPGRALVVHEPATRPARNAVLATLATARGWDPRLFLVDVTCEQALTGQHRRGRVLAAESFSGHWSRWSEQRPWLVEVARTGQEYGRWRRVDVVEREAAADTLTRALLAA